MDQSKTLLKTYDPTATMSITIDTSLKTGTYYFVLDGTGNSYASNYGSLGSYTITGFRSTLPIHDVTLSGHVEKNKHQLSWNIIADEPLKSLNVEYSTDGTRFNMLNNVSLTSRNMSYIPYDDHTRYYRLKATSQFDQIAYSNVIALRGINKTDMPFSVSTFVTNQIAVNASENYQYKIMDANGRIISSGNGNKGINNIDFSQASAGFYVIQLFGNTYKQSERIIRQ